jgi:lambda family phage holin
VNWWGNNSGGHVAWPFYFQHSTRKYREVRDDEMPHNPNTWLDLVQSWWRGDTPLGAVIMSIVMAGLRIAYFGGGGGWKRKTLEILLCGALTLTFASALEYVGWPKSLSVAIGGGVGLIGVDAIRGAAMRVIGNKFGGSKE